MARTNRPDEAYHIPTLNVWFALSGVALLVTSLWMVWADYNRSWKQTQRDFRDIERTRLAIDKDLAAQKLKAGELDGLKKAVEQAKAALTQKKAEGDAQIAKIEKLEQADHYTAKQRYNFARASLGDIRYQTEEYAEQHPKDEAGIKARMAAYECEVYRVEGGPNPGKCAEPEGGKSLKALYLDRDDELFAARTEHEKLIAEATAADAKVTAALAEVARAEKGLEVIESSFFNDTFRDAPLLDFLVPSLKIKQAVINDIRDDYNFATVQKEDRCMTCHLGIDQKLWQVHPESGRFVELSARKSIEQDVYAALDDYIDSALKPEDREDAKEAITDFQKDPKVTLAKWLDDTFDDDALVAGFNKAAASELEELRVRTQTYKAHPSLELYTTSASPHPMEQFGCSVCHEGRGHATEFDRAYHTPSNKDDKEHWEATYSWEAPHYWDYPQLPKDRVVASCAKCHDAEPKTVGAGALNAGRDLVRELGCYGCHRIEGMTGKLRQAGPSLRNLPSKDSREFTYSWIWEPKHFRPSTKMPRFFGQTNNSEPNWVARSQQEVRGIVAYLYTKPDAFKPGPMPKGDGNAARGKVHFEELGCLGCHSMESAGLTVNHHGPDLSGLGSKGLSDEWLFAWVKDPRKYFPKTHMPSLRLSDQEALDVVAYLQGQKKAGYKPHPIPSRDEAVQVALLEEALSSTMRRGEMKALFDKMSPESREVMLGEKSIAKYGCFGCHEIKGFESAGPIGTELTTWGDKFITQLDFGLIPHHGDEAEVDYTHIDWAKHKLENPRIYDRGKEKTKSYPELLKMPNFGLDEKDVSSLVTFLMSRRKQIVTNTKRPTPDTLYSAVQEGRWVVKQYNCHGCHYFDNEGGRLAQYWTVNSEGQPQFQKATAKQGFDFRKHIEGPVLPYAPPMLLDQGNKTRPDWLFGFLREPDITLRPVVHMRMPTFKFTDEEANALVRMFAGLEGRLLGDQSSYEPDPTLARVGQQLFQGENARCTQCHAFSDQDPKTLPPSVIAPNLKLAAQRLQETWIARWLEDPQRIMPGTKMPGYFQMDTGFSSLDPRGAILDADNNGKLSADELRHGMKAISDYLMSAGRARAAAAQLKTASR